MRLRAESCTAPREREKGAKWGASREQEARARGKKFPNPEMIQILDNFIVELSLFGDSLCYSTRARLKRSFALAAASKTA